MTSRCFSIVFEQTILYNNKLFKTLAKEAIYKIASFNSQDLSNILWSFAAAIEKGISATKYDDLFKVFANEIIHKIKYLNCQSISSIIWSFAVLNMRNEKMFDALTKEIMVKIKDFDPQGLSNIIWGFATLNIKYSNLINSLISEINNKIKNNKIKNFNTQDIINTIWSFAVLDIKNVEILTKLINQIDITSEFETTAIRQLKYVDLYFKHVLKCKIIWPTKILKLINNLKCEPSKSSNIHLEFAKTLKSLGIKFNNEYIINDLVVDIFIPKNNVVVEINGPTHYIYNTKKFNGNTVFKENLLKCMGYKVITVPYWELNKTDEIDKINYVRSLSL